MNLPFLNRLIVFCMVLGFSPALQAAEFGFSRHYSNHTVLQRDKPVTIRGVADKGTKVTVTFTGQTKEAVADGLGEWVLSLDPMPASDKGADLIAKSAGKQAALADVLVGDVFLFALQTTIDVSLGRDEAGKKAAADLPALRVMMVNTIPSTDPQSNLAPEATDGWMVLDKKTALQMNAAAYHMARGLAKESDVPIGIIDLNLGHHYPIALLAKDALLETTDIFGPKANWVGDVMSLMEKARRIMRNFFQQ